MCRAGSVVAMVTDSCQCTTTTRGPKAGYCCKKSAHMRLSQPAFEQLAHPVWNAGSGIGVGTLNVKYRQVTCEKANGIRVVVDSSSDKYYLALRFENIGGPGILRSVEVRTRANCIISILHYVTADSREYE